MWSEEQQRFYAIKLFERDDKVLEQLKLGESVLSHIEADIKAAEKEMDDDAESIITNERYIYIGSIIKGCLKKKSAGKPSLISPASQSAAPTASSPFPTRTGMPGNHTP